MKENFKGIDVNKINNFIEIIVIISVKISIKILLL